MSGPTNVTQGSTVVFTVAFQSTAGALTVPSSATLTMTYTTVAGTTASSQIAMTQSGSFFTASWESGQAKLGLANYSVSGAGQATATLGQLRLLNPPST